ncbi:hypothetical protein DL93DRAFT_1292908 [Clavulina sp. PMI_390]|nr:hypothetical protein DL93DRAFT_1292908 [Clavulina sp. PMI_390]
MIRLHPPASGYNFITWASIHDAVRLASRRHNLARLKSNSYCTLCREGPLHSHHTLMRNGKYVILAAKWDERPHLGLPWKNADAPSLQHRSTICCTSHIFPIHSQGWIAAIILCFTTSAVRPSRLATEAILVNFSLPSCRPRHSGPRCLTDHGY